ncbi:MAG: ribonuclease P protein component [Chloroflexi bacterium]|nr:MAG: ribonuclease P protein component [Chloroflexota bacterium]
MRKQLRLRRAKDFARLRQQGQTIRHPLMILSLLPNDLPYNRYGIITSKRLGNAVKRNRTRRLIREAVRLLHDGLKQGYDVVIITRHESVGKPYKVIQEAVYQLFLRVNLVKENK